MMAIVHSFAEWQRIRLALRIARTARAIVDVIAPAHITRR